MPTPKGSAANRCLSTLNDDLGARRAAYLAKPGGEDDARQGGLMNEFETIRLARAPVQAPSGWYIAISRLHPQTSAAWYRNPCLALHLAAMDRTTMDR